MKDQVITLLNTVLACFFAVARSNPVDTCPSEQRLVTCGLLMESRDLLALARSINRG